jgi:hypothetical protein
VSLLIVLHQSSLILLFFKLLIWFYKLNIRKII